MKREDLIAMGISEENVEKIMAEHGKAVQSANAKVAQYKDLADKVSKLQAENDELKNQNLSENEKITKALEAVQKENAELKKRDAVRTQRANAMEKFGITAEQASKVVTDDGATDYEVLGQIFTESRKNAVAEYEKQKLNDTPNPNGTKGNPGKDDKPEDVKNAESITFGNMAAEQTAKDYYKI